MEPSRNTRLPGSIFFFLVLVGAVQAFSHASRMPERVATHFGGNGMVNGWQSKVAFFATEASVIVVAAVISFGVPRVIGLAPLRLMNLPNKEYWFAPERRAGTLAYFRAQFAWFGCGLLAFLLFVNELVFRANLSYPHRLETGPFVTGLVLFLSFTAIWSIWIVVHFSKKSAR